MEYRCCQPPCARFIASDDPHSKCVKCFGFSHTREAVYGILKCTFCENLHLRTLRFQLEVFEKESSVFPCHAPEAYAPPPWVRDLGFGCRARGDGEWADRPRLFSPERTNSPDEFAHDYLYPSPGAHDTVSFGLDDIYIYIYVFSRRFYPKRLTVHSGDTFFFISMCVPWESNPQPFALLTQCSTTEPHRNTVWYIANSSLRLWGFRACFSRCSPA